MSEHDWRVCALMACLPASSCERETSIDRRINVTATSSSEDPGILLRYLSLSSPFPPAISLPLLSHHSDIPSQTRYRLGRLRDELMPCTFVLLPRSKAPSLRPTKYRTHTSIPIFFPSSLRIIHTAKLVPISEAIDLDSAARKKKGESQLYIPSIAFSARKPGWPFGKGERNSRGQKSLAPAAREESNTGL